MGLCISSREIMGSFELELRGKEPTHGLMSEEIYDKQGKKTPGKLRFIQPNSSSLNTRIWYHDP